MENARSTVSELPDANAIDMLRERPGVWLSFAGSAFLQLYRDALAPLGLRPNWVVALAILHQYSGVTQSALGRRMGINRASSMAMSVSLEEARFVDRNASAGRRQTILTLTPLGSRMLLEACRIEEDLRTTMFGWMTGDALRELVDTLRRATNLAKGAVHSAADHLDRDAPDLDRTAPISSTYGR